MYSAMNPWAQQPPPPGKQGQYGYPQAPPAYHPVQVRQSFNPQPLQYVPLVQQPLPPPPPPTMAPVEAAPRKKIDWPQPVRNYVARSFDPKALLDDVSRPDMEAKLKQTITNATDNNTLDTLDWDNMPLPQQMIRHERVASAWQQESVDLRVGGMVTNSKKRKSQENVSNDEDSGATPPWRANSSRIEDRITYGHQSSHKEISPKHTSKSQEKRQKRFGATKSYKRSPSPEPTSGPVVGTCEVLEKRYFRLTSAPIPSQVRPEPVLRKTLELLKKKWRSESNYGYICDQFKSMRQDLTVQRIRNEFTVTVYEIHARIALEKADLGEYNQCQTQLRALYAQNLGGNPVEFKAYRILYFIHTSNRTALNDVLADLTTAEKEEQAIKHALGVRSALALGNYHRFFRLYLETPNMGAYLMDMFVVRERLAALANICKAYKPDVKIRFITEELGFESDHQTCQFIVDYNGQHLIEEKEDDIRFLCAKGTQLFEAARKDAFRTVDIKGQI